MINAIISDFSRDYLRPAIYDLEKNGIIKIKKWILKDKDDVVNHEKRIWWWDIVFRKSINGVPLTENEIDYILANTWAFEQQMSREKVFELGTSYNLHNHILKFAVYFKNIIIQEKVDLVLFLDVPHGRYDFLLYKIAKMLNVKTLFCMASFWNGYSFIYENLDDIGKYEVTGNKNLSIEEKYEKYLPYMNKLNTKEKVKQKIANVCKFKSFVKDKQETFLRNKRIYSSFDRYLLIHLERVIKRQLAKNIYKKMYKNNFNDKIYKDEKFVYFPLHLQPEATTDTLGGRYYDQVLAIEKLRKILPEGWMIYIKENPKQTYYMRDQTFFDRVKNIKGIRLLGKNVDTYELMQKCQFVATITGTAGWEAISGGKNALVFGYAWYRYLPGVSIYNENISLDDILNRKINHSELEIKAYYLKNTAYKFVTEDYYTQIMQVCNNTNSKNLYNALLDAFGKHYV